MFRASVLMLAVPIVAAVGSPAFANDIPGSSSTTAVLPISNQEIQGRFETAKDSDWYRVTLTKGQDYTVSGSGAIDCCNAFTVDLRDKTGKILASADDYIGRADAGFEFRAPYSGLYFVEYKQTTAGPPDNGPYGYGARVSTDCRAGTTTKCSIAVGQTIKGLLAFGYDKDWFRTTLTAGKSYSVKTNGPGGTLAYVMDATGHLVAGGTAATIHGFAPSTSGTYYVKVSTTEPQPGNGIGTTYSVALTSP
jgi:hypothetical protein